MKDLYIAKTFAGLEEVLAQELRDLQIDEIEILNRAVSFKGDLKDLYTANYWCRTAIRILKPIADFPAEDELALYKGIRTIDWSQLMGLEDTFAIDATLSNSKINHSQYAALKTKDAIADQFVFKFNERPNVETTRPTLRIGIFIQDDHCTVSLDTSNISLHKRGYRVSAGSAPLNEVLAAGMILLSDWDKKSNFVDPMCGSGTLLIEAALIAMNIPPASYRDYFGFLNFKDFDAALWKEVKTDGLAQLRDIDFKIVGTDLAAGMIAVAEKNIQSAHLQKDIQLEQISMQDFTPPEGGGIMVCNPPYGERIRTRDIVDLYRDMGDTMKQKYGGYNAWIISSDIIALKQIGLYPSRKIELYNGPLECRFEKFEIYDGSKKEKYLNLKSSDNPQEDRPKGPAYRKNEDWDKEGKTTKFKGKTKSEWEIDADMKDRKREPKKEFGKKDRDTRGGGRSDRGKSGEKSSYASRSSSPRKDFDRSEDKRGRSSDSDKRGEKSNYASRSSAPRREYDKSDDRRGTRSDSDNRGEKSSYPSRSSSPRREFDKSDDRRGSRTDSDNRGEKSSYTYKSSSPRREFDKSDDRRGSRTDSDNRGEKSSYTSKSSSPRREFDKSDDRRGSRTDSGNRGEKSSYTSKSSSPRREFDKSDDRRGSRSDSDNRGERSSYPSKSREPRKEFDKSDDRRGSRSDSDNRGERSYASKTREPRREFDKSSDRRGSRSDSDNKGERSSYIPKGDAPKREVRKYSREIRVRRSESEKSTDNKTFYPKGKPPRKRIPKKPDND